MSTKKNGASRIVEVARNSVVGVYSLTWAANAGSGTAETVSVPIPDVLNGKGLYLVSIYNPTGLASSITLSFENQINFGTSVGLQYSTLTTLDVASGSVQDEIIQGWPFGDGTPRISATNDQTASASGGTVVVVVRAI